VLIQRYDTTEPGEGFGTLSQPPFIHLPRSDSHMNSAGKVANSLIVDPHVINTILDELVAILSAENSSADHAFLRSIATRSIELYMESQLVENRQFRTVTRRGISTAEFN
jgi:hypothetical protein